MAKKIKHSDLIKAGFTSLGDGEYKKGDFEIYFDERPNGKSGFYIKSDHRLKSIEMVNSVFEALTSPKTAPNL